MKWKVIYPTTKNPTAVTAKKKKEASKVLKEGRKAKNENEKNVEL